MIRASDFQQRLKQIGWPITIDDIWGVESTTALRNFQRGFSFWNLAVDGQPGPDSFSALDRSIAADGAASNHFAFREFASPDNGYIKLHRELVRSLELYRTMLGRPVKIVSGYRTEAYNNSVGGAKNSQHLYGNAADLEPAEDLADVKSLFTFGGIGIIRANKLVRHVDVRHVDPPVNFTQSTVHDPSIWYYG